MMQPCSLPINDNHSNVTWIDRKGKVLTPSNLRCLTEIPTINLTRVVCMIVHTVISAVILSIRE